MRKSLLYLLCTAVIAVGSINMYTQKDNRSNAYSKAEIAMELSTETVLSESNADEKLPMASTTKILTAIIIIEDCNLDEVIKIPSAAVGAEGSSIYLKKDEEIDIRDLLYGLMLRSGNDSAAALAIHHSGSIDKFANVMNERAKLMGAQNSNFKNPSGLPDSEHYTTARDLCKISCYAMQNKTFAEIVSTTNYNGKFKSFTNKNKILSRYEGANGVKTGYTLKAGRCLVSSAKREGMDVVCVVLNCPDMYETSEKLFDFCFNNYKLLTLDKNKVFMYDKVLCKLRENKNLVINNSDIIRYEVKGIDKMSENDCAVAELKIYIENNLIFTEKLYTIIDN